MNFPLKTACTVSHRFGVVVFSFPFFFFKVSCDFSLNLTLNPFIVYVI